MSNDKGVGIHESDHKQAVKEARAALSKMNELYEKNKHRMKTIRLKDGTIIHSTSEDNLKQYIENDKKVLRVGY